MLDPEDLALLHALEASELGLHGRLINAMVG
jgi:hypothetical protein